MNVRPAELQCDPDPAGAWLLAWTKPRQESVARANLERQGFEAYLPMFRTLKRGADEPVLEPMFPRYLFLRPRSASQSVSVVRSTRGVASLVRFGIELATVPDSALQCIRDVERVRSEASKAELCALRPGQKVIVCSGPFQGLEALVDAVSSKRVVVLLEILGRQSRVGVEHQQLVAA